MSEARRQACASKRRRERRDNGPGEGGLAKRQNGASRLLLCVAWRLTHLFDKLLSARRLQGLGL
jgi:hypothetical protein